MLCVVGTALLRNNGLFAFALLIPALLIAARGWRRQTALLLAACLCAAGMVNGGLTLLLHPSRENTSFQLYSIPAQQLVRAYNSGTMSDADKEEIRSWYVSDEGLAVYPHLADPAKGYLDRERIQRSGGDFLALWQKHAKTHAHEYLEAFLMLNVGSWYPDDLSQSTIYPDVSYNDKGYLQLQETDMRAYGIETTCFLPAVRDLFEQICRRNSYQKYPLVSLLFAVATPFWLILFACAKLISGMRARMLPAALGALGVYDKIGKYAGAGSIVPITGFANSVVSPAMEFRREGLVMGVGAKLFTVAGPVLVYGISASVIAGIIYYIFGLY